MKCLLVPKYLPKIIQEGVFHIAGANVCGDGARTALKHPIHKRSRPFFLRSGGRKNARLLGWGNRSAGGTGRRTRPLSGGHFVTKTDTSPPRASTTTSEEAEERKQQNGGKARKRYQLLHYLISPAVVFNVQQRSSTTVCQRFFGVFAIASRCLQSEVDSTNSPNLTKSNPQPPTTNLKIFFFGGASLMLNVPRPFST